MSTTTLGANRSPLAVGLTLLALAAALLWWYTQQTARTVVTTAADAAVTSAGTIAMAMLGGELVRKSAEDEFWDYDGYKAYSSPCGENLDPLSYIWCLHAKGRGFSSNRSEFTAATRQELYELAEDIGRELLQKKGVGRRLNSKEGSIYVLLKREVGTAVLRSGEKFRTKWVRVSYKLFERTANKSKLRLKNLFADVPPKEVLQEAIKKGIGTAEEVFSAVKIP